ncbi:glycosyl transferase [Alcaligenaceae bacterium]|nr:glycosyl transferase [Alcaligenaceae bacterium]
MVYLLTAFLVSLTSALMLVRYKQLHSRYAADGDLVGLRQHHVPPVPRVGGVALALAVLASSVPLAFREPSVVAPLLSIWICAMPAFLGGLAGDLSKKIPAKLRFAFIAVSSVLVYAVLNVHLTRLNILGVDWLLQFTAISFVATLIVIGGAVSAINIIDGYNGLAAVVSVLIFAGFAYVAFFLGDRLLLVLSVSMIGAICGFLIWSYPNGLIFLGSGGAYFIGYMVGVVALLLLARHPNVSAWFPLLLCFYPAFEALYFIYRKACSRGRSLAPERVHLHMLIYKRIMRWADVGPGERRSKTQHNTMVSPFLWVFSSLAGVPAVLFWRNEPVLIGCAALFAGAYMLLYRALLRCRITPQK